MLRDDVVLLFYLVLLFVLLKVREIAPDCLRCEVKKLCPNKENALLLTLTENFLNMQNTSKHFTTVVTLTKSNHMLVSICTAVRIVRTIGQWN